MNRILVVGDEMQDVYIWGRATRLCPEAPAPVFVTDSTEHRSGGAALVLDNIIGMGGNAVLVPCSLSRKTRYFADRHLVLRVDSDSFAYMPENLVISHFDEKMHNPISAIVVSDYDKGGISKDFARHILESADALKVPVFVDAKCHDAEEKYSGAHYFVPNEHEHKNVDMTKFFHVIRKLGPRGCEVDGEVIPTVEATVFDVTGAGDVFIAALALSIVNGMEIKEAAKCANRAASESVKHLGTYVCSPKDLGIAKQDSAESRTAENTILSEKSQVS